MALGLGRARADEPLRPAWDLDGLWITAGPVGGAVNLDGAWTTAAGAELSLVRVQERRFPAAFGLAFGGVGYSERDGGRLWLDAEAAIARPFGLGLSVGTTIEVDPVNPPRFGGQATLWLLLGVVPYVRAGWVDVTGGFFEAGLMIKIPAIRLD